MIEKFQNWFHENSITEVECLVPDLGGIARGKILPTNKFLKGLEDESHRLPQSTFIQTISGDYATEDSAGALPRSVYNPTDIDVILKPDFSNIHLEGQNLVQTPTLSITITNNTTHQLFNKNPPNNTNDIKRYTALIDVQFFIFFVLYVYQIYLRFHLIIHF